MPIRCEAHPCPGYSQPCQSSAGTLSRPVWVCFLLCIFAWLPGGGSEKFHIYFQQLNTMSLNKRNIYQRHFSVLYFCKHLMTCRKNVSLTFAPRFLDNGKSFFFFFKFGYVSCLLSIINHFSAHLFIPTMFLLD